MGAVEWKEVVASGERVVVLVDHDAEAAFYRSAIAELRDATHIETIRVLPLSQWLVELWDASFPVRQVLRPAQLLALAERVIADSDVLPTATLGKSGIARRFVDAFEIAARYSINPSATAVPSVENATFLEWQASLQRLLDEQASLTSGQLATLLQDEYQSGALDLPSRAYMSVQLRPSATEQQLLSLLGREMQIEELPHFESVDQVSARQYVAEDLDQEVSAAAIWVTDIAKNHGDSAPRIAVIAADMSVYEEHLRRELERRMCPSSLFSGVVDGGMSEPWRIGTGKLSGYPVVAAAIDILDIAGAPSIDLEVLSRVNRSTFIGEADEFLYERCAVDLLWRRNLSREVTFDRVIREARRNDLESSIQWLADLTGAADKNRSTALPSEWVRRFDAELLSAGWPNRDAGDAVVDQCRQGFSQVMDILRGMDRQLGRVGRRDALRWLSHILDSKRFELKRDDSPLVHVLSLEDAVGQQFDYAWILGLSDNALPKPLQPSPFIPRTLLQAAGVPRCDANNALELDAEMLASVCGSASNLVMSYAHRDAESSPQAGCTLLPWDWEILSLPEAHRPYVLDGSVSTPDKDPIPAVSDEERKALRGGTGVFKAYAASPFLAFAKYRLGLSEFPEPVEGLDARTQGNWVHRALEIFWSRFKTSEALNAMSEEELAANVRACVVEATEDADYIGDSLKEVERRRISSMVEEWLNHEKGREEAFVVESTEKRGRIEAFGIPLTIQIDRVDRIGDHRIVMDYKTGTVSAKKLNASQLLEPQLPLYALLGSEFAGHVDGLCLAQIKPRGAISVHVRSAFTDKLFKRSRGSGVGSPEAWAGELAGWERALQGYAAGFLSGYAEHNDTTPDSEYRFEPYLAGLARTEATADE